MTHQKCEPIQFVIIHGYADDPEDCVPGEETIAVIMIYRRRWYWIPWGPTHLILIDFLCRNRWIGLDAWQIAGRMGEDPFVVQHGLNAPGHCGRPARTSRTNVRQQVTRSRHELAALIAEEQLDLDAWDIIRSEKTSTGTVRYKICVDDVIWKHLPSPVGSGEFSDPRIPWIHPGLFSSAGASGIANVIHGA